MEKDDSKLIIVLLQGYWSNCLPTEIICEAVSLTSSVIVDLNIAKCQQNSVRFNNCNMNQNNLVSNNSVRATESPSGN